MSKALIIGDLHFGVRANSQEYLNFQLKWFRDELFPNIEKNEVDHVIFLGDVNDSRISLSPLIAHEQRNIFLELKNKFPDLTVHCILGNHDIYYRSTREIHSLQFLKDIGFNLYEEFTEIEIDDKRLLFLPWILKNEFGEVTERLANNKYDCVFGHLEIKGFEMTKGIIDNTGMEIDLFDNCEKVFSGHYHIRNKNGKIQYTGTPYEMSFSDSNDIKGIDLIDFETMKTRFIKSKKIPLHISFNSETYPFEQLNKKLVTNNLLKVKLLNNLTEVQKIEYCEKINSLNPFKVIFEDEDEDGLRVNDEEVAASIKNTLEFLDEYINLIEVDEDLDVQDIKDEFKNYYNKAHI